MKATVCSWQRLDDVRKYSNTSLIPKFVHFLKRKGPRSRCSGRQESRLLNPEIPRPKNRPRDDTIFSVIPSERSEKLSFRRAKPEESGLVLRQPGTRRQRSPPLCPRWGEDLAFESGLPQRQDSSGYALRMTGRAKPFPSGDAPSASLWMLRDRERPRSRPLDDDTKFVPPCGLSNPKEILQSKISHPVVFQWGKVLK